MPPYRPISLRRLATTDVRPVGASELPVPRSEMDALPHEGAGRRNTCSLLCRSILSRANAAWLPENNKHCSLPSGEIKRRKLPPYRCFVPCSRAHAIYRTARLSRTTRTIQRWNGICWWWTAGWKRPKLSNIIPRGGRTLRTVKAQGGAERYLCRHRTPWHRQKIRPPALFVCPYPGRSPTARARPFRFILNHIQAAAANVHLMPHLKRPLTNSESGRYRTRQCSAKVECMGTGWTSGNQKCWRPSPPPPLPNCYLSRYRLTLRSNPTFLTPPWEQMSVQASFPSGSGGVHEHTEKTRRA